MKVQPGRVNEGGNSFLPALLFLIFSIAGLSWIVMKPSATGPVAVVMAPWASGKDAFLAVAAADGDFLRMGAFGNIIIAQGRDPGFSDRVKALGAWVVIRPLSGAACSGRIRNPSIFLTSNERKI